MVDHESYRRAAARIVDDPESVTRGADLDMDAPVYGPPQPANGGAWVPVMIWISDEYALKASQGGRHGEH